MMMSTAWSRYSRRWIPAWPSLGAFFAGALLLTLIAHHAGGSGAGAAIATWAGFASHMAIGVVAAVLAGIAFGFVAVAALRSELGLRRRSYGAKSLTIFLLATVAAFLIGKVALDMDIESHSVCCQLSDPIDLRIMPVLLFALVAWPVGYLAGLGYGAAALCRRGEWPGLGLVGICCNLLALPVWYISVFEQLPNTSI